MSAEAPPPKPLSAEEVLAHPEYPYVWWDLTPEKKGKVAVADGRTGGPLNIDYEVHGRGPIKLAWIMGLGALKGQWQRQTKDFGHTQGDKYTCLIFDNRGIGKSDKPLRRYSTSEMAKDTLELLDHIGWTGRRSVHVVGISMGGMIAQELGLMIPERIASLSLVSTAAGLFNIVGYFENLRNRINLFIPRAIDIQLANIKSNMFSTPWLLSPDEAFAFNEVHTQSFPTNGDRFAASEMMKRAQPTYTKHGFISQALAAGWHHKSPEQLKELADKVGKERIMVVHGRMDKMIGFGHAPVLVKGLEAGSEGSIKTHFEDGQGHVIPIEMRKVFCGWVEELVKRAGELNKAEGV